MTADEIYGWWGDAAVVVAEDRTGTLGGGVLDRADRRRRGRPAVRGPPQPVVFAGGGAGVELRDVQHGDTTITVLDFAEAAGFVRRATCRAGYKAEIA